MPKATPEPRLIIARTASCRDDAKRLYGHVSGQLGKLTYGGFNNGAIVFPPLFRSYLVRRGLLPA